MPHLDERLKTVARQISGPVHADIGSDHGHLLKALLAAGRIRHGIAIENKRQPFENSRRTLAGESAEVRFADGLDGLRPNEADSISICGMGGQSMVRILDNRIENVPGALILQPNRNPELIRQWGLRNQFHLLDEQIAIGHWPYVILRFEKAEPEIDPTYEGLDKEAAILFGPHLIRRAEKNFHDRLLEEKNYLESLDQLSDEFQMRMRAIERVLG